MRHETVKNISQVRLKMVQSLKRVQSGIQGVDTAMVTLITDRYDQCPWLPQSTYCDTAAWVYLPLMLVHDCSPLTVLTSLSEV